MKTVSVSLPDQAYDILIGERLLSDAADRIVAAMPRRRAVVVTNEIVRPLYADQLIEALTVRGVAVSMIVIRDGEAFKTWATLNHILDSLLEQACERSTTLIALGGGVVGDMTGFAAAIFQRGMPFIQIPTTLLAQVDSSVGGKTGINHPLGKNMIGAFYQPRLVLADLSTLQTLPSREFSAGLAEVIKYGLIDDPDFFEWLESNVDRLMRKQMAELEFAVARCCENKARIVAADEKEQGVRAWLNLGHTFGHAIEAGLGYGNWLHGEAVAAGIVLAARVSHRLGGLAADDVKRIEALITRAGLPVEPPKLGFQRWMSLMAQDKKVDSGTIRFILLKGIGQAYVGTVDEDVLRLILT